MSKKIHKPFYSSYSHSIIDEVEENKTEDIIYFLIKLLKSSTSPNLSNITYLHHYKNRQYQYISSNVKNLVGYTSEDFLEGGTDFLIQIHQEDDFRIFSDELFKTIIGFLSTKQATEYRNYRFTYNYRLKHKKGGFVHIMQQCSYLDPNGSGRPVISFGTCSNITAFKTDNRMHLKIEHVDEEGNSKIISENNYFPDPKDDLLSHRELEILKWVIEGLSSKEIADKICLSTHTVNTHRKNMLVKSNAKNTADLIRYAILKGLI